MNKERLALFLAVYKIELTKARTKFPEQYVWPMSELDVVFQRMAEAIVKGSFHKDSHAFKATCKAFGLKHTYTAIREFLAGESK